LDIEVLLMKIGDEVRIKDGEEHKDYAHRYCGTIGTIKHIADEYCEVVLYDGKVAIFPIDYLVPYIKMPKLRKKCTCGAESTAFPKHHYDWCDIHMVQKNENIDLDDFFEFDWDMYNLPFTD
jgi:hypothetical protein